MIIQNVDLKIMVRSISKLASLMMWELDNKKGWAPDNWCLWTMAEALEKNSWEFLGQQDQTSLYHRQSTLNIHWKEWCWSWSSNTLTTSCKELTHWKRSQSWERLKAGGEGEDRGWDDLMESLTQWTWVWANSGRWLKDREAWCIAAHGVAKSWTWLST